MPLGLKGTGGLLDKHDHQVLAIGYDMGRYAGNLGSYIGDLKIRIGCITIIKRQPDGLYCFINIQHLAMLNAI